ncbi:1-aminocyclopropane-1-carboxylate deaminase/D-cysteine desulfhydrase [Streptomyces lonarensis]|uniref:Pyridoxal-phosphate dependent enzyme n=1 Tax=Streptomyces lonarensis TaxID=700599 RepID=A0A7X6CZ35_9ACTN|nr:pyridoxal-phosphate dependent enzyme [Streptomyces lonarensis]NJQ05192.1 pyridoxal-phosphate dependent enzyme [Streptomyces lonarensis]
MTNPPEGSDPLAALGPARLPSPLQEIDDERFTARGVRLLLKRDDLVHPRVIGNKWRKLTPHLRAALVEGTGTVVTVGGAYSNHLRALAAAGRPLGLRTVGIVRGDELAGRPLNPSLARCAADGMRLHFVSRAEYRTRHDAAFARAVRERFGPARLVPEGGSDPLAVSSCAELGRELAAAHPRPDVVALPCGTAGTLAGVAAGLAPDQRVLGVPVVRDPTLGDAVRRFQEAAFGGPRGRWELATGFEHGGYGRTPPALLAFAADFADRHGVPVEHCYVAKLLYALAELTRRGSVAPGTVLAAVVTGRPEDPRAPDLDNSTPASGI